MSRDTKAVVGTIVACTLALGVLVTTMIGARIDDLGDRIDDLGARIDRLDDRVDDLGARIDRLDDRLRAVEVGFGKVDQRLATLERLHLPTPPAAE